MTTQFEPTHSAAGELAYARARDLAFDAIMNLWRRRSEAGMTQKELAMRISCSRSLVSRSLKGPGNWTLRTLAEFADALDGELEIHVFGLEDPPSNRDNYDAYEAHKPEPEPEEPMGLIKNEDLPPSDEPLGLGA
jgi:transcriptional regulator with XRE-family HTH domain